MIIKNLVKITHFDYKCIQCDVYFNDKCNKIFFGIHKDYENYLTDFLDSFMVGLLIPCMYYNEDMHIEGKVTEELLDNINNSNLQNIISTIIPHCKKINITATEISKRKTKNKITLSGFSGGVDSFVTLQEYFLNPKTDDIITHFLYNNLIYKDEIADNKYKFLSRIIKDKLHMPFIRTYTNMHKLYDRKLHFEQTCTLRNGAIPYLFNTKVNFLYSSTFETKTAEIKKYQDMSIANIFILPLLSTETVIMNEVGNEYGRVEKTLVISNNSLTYKYLDICVKPKISKNNHIFNCSTCYKCMRACVTFEKLGILENFSNIFNIEKYKDKKEEYLKQVKDSIQLNDINLVNFLETYNEK